VVATAGFVVFIVVGSISGGGGSDMVRRILCDVVDALLFGMDVQNFLGEVVLPSLTTVPTDTGDNEWKGTAEDAGDIFCTELGRLLVTSIPPYSKLISSYVRVGSPLYDRCCCFGFGL
jgi:hypothetical protein